MLKVDDLIWGMSLTKNETHYVVNPKQILNIILNNPEVQDSELLGVLSLETSLEELTYLYQEHKVPLVIPKHFKLNISQNDLPYSYKNTLELVPLIDYL